MYNWEEEINKEAKAQKKRWNGKVITTAKQWNNNCDGAREPAEASYDKIWGAVRDYYNSREWN